jgi:hypothetical protein
MKRPNLYSQGSAAEDKIAFEVIVLNLTSMSIIDKALKLSLVS